MLTYLPPTEAEDDNKVLEVPKKAIKNFVQYQNTDSGMKLDFQF